MPARHFSARGLHDRDRTLWGGFWISLTSEERDVDVYFCGDTGWDPALFDEMRQTKGRPGLGVSSDWRL